VALPPFGTHQPEVDLDEYTAEWTSTEPAGLDPGLELAVSAEQEKVIVAVDGELDLETVGQLLRCVDGVLEGGHPEVVLDLRRTSFMDSVGLGTLVGLHKRARARGGAVTLRNPTPRVQFLLDLTAVGTVVVVESTEPATGE
jgi:anti-sigma B factor antagonist